jgi:cation diffusion facilitator family transporter
MIPLLPPRRSPRALQRAKKGEGRRTIFIALAANAVICAAKLAAGLVSGSSGMLAEAAHSAADTLNEGLLAASLRRDRRPPHPAHPVGRGRERFLWAFMAAIASFVVGGCVSVFLAVRQLGTRAPLPDARAAWIVLAISFAAEGISWAQSLRQARRQAREYRLPLLRYLRRASDPVVRAVVFEDSAALAGLVFAAAGLFLSERLGSSLPDALASLAIGLLLAGTAFGLARPLADFLVGRSLPPEQLETLHGLLASTPGVESVVTLHALYSGPEEVIVVAKVRPAPRVDSGALARAMDEVEERIRAALPVVADVFVDVTRRPNPAAGKAKRTAAH